MNSDRNIISSTIERLRRGGDGGVDMPLLEIESIRSALSLCLSIAVVLTVVHLPWQERSRGVGWRSIERSEVINILPEPQEIMEPDDIEGGIITVFDDALPEEEEKTEMVEEEDVVEEEGEENTEEENRMTRMDRIELSPILEFVDQSPSIVGGLSSLYLNIDYPLSARDKGIQGLTVLMFVVEQDGSTSNIEVLKSLHPACDSAAVAAVSQTRFNPGIQDGKEVRVKMRLPIRFKLVNRHQRYTEPDSLRAPS